MTFAVTIKVDDGVVLAADSASSITTGGPLNLVHNVYYNANKIFNICKGIPIAAMAWGGGSIGTASISSLVKDFRSKLSSEGIQNSDYSVEAIAHSLRDFLSDLYIPAFKEWPLADQPHIGLIVAGYSKGQDEIEEYQIDILGEVDLPPLRLEKTGDTGAIWRGQNEAVSRLVLGFSTILPQILQNNLGVEAETATAAMKLIRSQTEAPLVSPAMPIQDAIDLAEFLVNLTINFSRFMPGAQVVGGPVEIASVTKHEGFKWIRRKHYYQQGLNP